MLFALVADAVFAAESSAQLGRQHVQIVLEFRHDGQPLLLVPVARRGDARVQVPVARMAVGRHHHAVSGRDRLHAGHQL